MVPPVPEPGSFGEFDKLVVSRWRLDGRKMELVDSIAFVDATGLRWEVPSGAVVDGASIPPIFWSLIGGPYEGLYRDASVVHDYECDVKRRPWRSVHRMFWYAARARGESEALANLMYWAIMVAGPRWPTSVVPPSLSERDVLTAQLYFERHPPTSLDDIDALTLDAVRAMNVTDPELADARARITASRSASRR